MNFTCCHKNQWTIPLVVVGVFLASAVLFLSVAKAADEADIQAAIQDLSSATGQNITSEDQAIALCNQEQYLDICADIGKKYELYEPEELKQVDSFLSEVKGKILDDIKSCTDEECLIRVATELATKIKTKNPTLATDLDLTTTIVAEKKAVVQAAKEVGVNFSDCESMDPDTAPVDLLKKCAKLAKDGRVQRYIPEERRVLAEQFEDSATVKLREALGAGKYQCGDGTLEGCGNYCLNPDAATKAAGIPAVCTQIAKEIFGQDGVKQLESAHQYVGQVKDHYSKKFILTLPDGRELVGEGQIRNACDRAFSSRNFEVAKACGSFVVQNGFAAQAEVDQGLKLMESFTQKGQDVDFDECLANPAACRDFIPADERERFDVGSQIFEIMKSEIGFEPFQCERGAVDEAIGKKCFEGSKRALAKIEGLGLANKSREARFIIEDIKRHVTQGEELTSRKDQFKQTFSQEGGPGGCKSEGECFAYCSDPANGPECIAFGAKQNISGFRGQEAVQKFQEYNQHVQRPGLVSDEFRPYPGQGPYPGFQPPGQGEFPPPGQVPGFTQPGPGFAPPPGIGIYPGPGPVGPSPECFAAIQSGDFVRAKTVCYVPPQEHPFPSPQICPATPYIECPAGQYRESFRNNDGCWVDGQCLPAPTYSPGPYPTYTYSPPPPPPEGYQCSDGKDNDGDGKTDYPADSSCYGPDDSDEYYPPPGVSPGTSPYPTYTPGPSCPAGQWWDYTYNKCTSATPPPSCPPGQWWDYTQNKCSSSTSPYPTYSPGPGTGSCSQYLISLLGDGCHQMYTDSSGRLIFCDGPMSKSAKEGDTATTPGCSGGGTTYTPYPTSTPPSTGSCPSGYHYHGESGGFCMNDQENYGGTCYDAAGTNKITCPAQPSYSPYPTTSSCSQTLINLLGSGCHWMYSDSSGRGIYCDGPMTKSAKEGDTATTASCSSGGTTYSPYPTSSGYTYTPPPSCPSGQWWDYATSTCKSTTTTTYTPAPSCPSGQWWDYTTSSCKSTSITAYCGNYVCDSGETSTSCPGDCGGGTTYTPYPTSTYTYTPPPSCSSTQYWNGTSCVDNVTTTYTPYPTTEYTPPPSTYSPPPPAESSPPPTSSNYNHYMVAHCQQLGRTWHGKICQANGLFTRFYENSGVASILRLFYMVP